MNEKHQGPHCAGSCEGAAYQIEIAKLRHDIERHVQIISDKEAENEALRSEIATEIKYHAGQESHYRAERLRKALAAHDKEGK